MTRPGAHWGSEYLLNRPFFPIPPSKNRALDMDNLSPLSKTMGFILPCQQGIVALITHLYLSSRPIAVLSRIGTIIITTFNAMLRTWAWSHILQKCRKRVLPLRTYRNTTSSIVWIRWCSRTQTPRFDTTPDTIFSLDSAVARCSMSQSILSPRFLLQTPTTTDVFASQIPSTNRYDVPTVHIDRSIVVSSACMRETWRHDTRQSNGQMVVQSNQENLRVA